VRRTGVKSRLDCPSPEMKRRVPTRDAVNADIVALPGRRVHPIQSAPALLQRGARRIG